MISAERSLNVSFSPIYVNEKYKIVIWSHAHFQILCNVLNIIENLFKYTFIMLLKFCQHNKLLLKYLIVYGTIKVVF